MFCAGKHVGGMLGLVLLLALANEKMSVKKKNRKRRGSKESLSLYRQYYPISTPILPSSGSGDL